MPFLGKFPTQIVDPEVDIDGGAIDGVTIGATTASAATVTTLTSGNITTTGYIAGPSTFTIDPAAVGDNTGTLVVAGNLQVDGTTTTINSTTMTVDDLNITLASGAANAAAANGAGITVDGASATLTYNSTPDAWSFNKNVGIGTTSPAAELHINNSSGATFTRISGTTAAVLDMYGGASNTKPIRFFGGSDTEAYAGIRALSNNLGLSFETGIGGSTAATERMRIDSSGNVGIGTTTTTAIRLTATTATANHVGLQVENSNTADSFGMVVKAGNDANDYTADFRRRDNTNIMRIRGDGNVGIGTTSPVVSSGYTSLTINDTTSGYLVLQNNGTTKMEAYVSGGTQATLRGTGVPLAFVTTAAHEMTFDTNGTERMRIDTSNRLLLGCTTSNGSYISSNHTQLNIQGKASGAIGSLMLRSQGTTNATTFELAASDGVAASYLWNGSNSAMVFGTNNTERMRIDSSGNVGIGASSPQYLLDLYGNPGTNAGALFRLNSSITDDNGIIYQQASGTSWFIGNETNNPNNYEFWYKPTSGSYSRVVTIDTNGSFRTGGGITARNQRVTTTTGGMDYHRMPVGHYTPGETVFEIDPTWSSEQLQHFFNLTSAQCDWVADSTAPGGYAIKITGNRSVGGQYASGFPYIPIDTDDKYYMECWIKTTGGGSLGHYMGSNEYNENFASLGGNPGSFGYWVMANTTITAAMGWTKVSGYITGFGTSIGQFEVGTKYWTPLALFNYTLNSGSRESYISGWKVIKVAKIPGDRRYSGHQFIELSASVGSGNGQNLYSSGSGIGLHANGSYSTCGAHIEIGTDATPGWANVYLQRTWASGEDSRFQSFLVNGTVVGTITHSGTSSTSYNTTSDYRLKENVVTLENATERLKQIPVHRFNFISDPDRTVDGFMAHEVSDYVPEAITGAKDETRIEEYVITEGVEEVLDDEGNIIVEGVEEVRGTREVPVYQNIDQSKLVPLMLATIKELEARITQLEGQ